MTAASAATPSDSRRGILLMLLGMSMFTFNDALGKWLVAEYPVAMLLAVRSLSGALLLAPLIVRHGVRAVFAVDRLPLHMLRVGCVAAEVACFYWAVRSLPLADVMTIYMAAPLIVTALSVPLLGEKVGWRRWAAVLVGFVGVVVVLNPAGQFDPLPSLVALAGSVIFSIGMISTRLLRQSSNLTLVSFQTFGTGVLGAAALPMAWTAPAIGSGFVLDVLLIAGLGVSALAGHAAMNRSLQLSPAAVVVPFQYVSIVWAVVLDWAVWGTAPTLRIALGALLIIGSGLFVFHREQALHRGAATDAGPDLGPGD